ncbi:MAG TPA: glycoside hydrolase family 3 C-terminal domain-containing protein [Terracidiphilus sp.]|jgi:beta-glucosidase|nr:glycoside hydrolase family 3 C-terminal domain-containing protein [Terracidiphilus sp.]
MRRSLIFAALCLIAGGWAAAQTPVPADAPYKNAKLPVDQRVADLLGRMTLEEKVSMLAGSGWMESMPIPRLGIPAIKMADGPMGVRAWYGSSAITNAANSQFKPVYSTSFPSGVCMAATWDPALVHGEGDAIGQEVKALGRDMILGPTVNINRQPLWGRNFEGYGEDPFLSGRMGAAYVRGVQGQGVIPSVKHFVANNEEYERHRIDAQISERALREIYLPAFETVVDAGAWNVMSAYNLVNGAHMAQNDPLLHEVLEKEFGFKGFVVSDWASTYSTAPTVNAGMDLEMPGGAPMEAMMKTPRAQKEGSGDGWLVPEKVMAEIKAGQIGKAQIDDNVGRILRVEFEAGLFEHQHQGGGEVDTPEERAIALQGATEGIVLLKNQGDLLPLDPAKVHSIAVIGPNAAVARTGGGGSSLVRPKQAIAPLDGIKARAGKLQVTYSLGVGMEGEDAAHDTPEERAKDLQEAVDAASHADVAILFVGRYSGLEHEGADVATMDLPAGQDALIEAVEKANPHTVVVLNTGDPVTMTQWIRSTPALLDMWYGGQEGGRAIASILFGDANPSGKLPVTLPRRFEDCPCYGHYPGENLKVDYAEGIYVGYRYYDTKNVIPQFPFGFGLSYTNFAYTNLTLQRNAGTEPVWEYTADIRNVGKRAGAEVVELYVHEENPKIDRPVHELKGFSRVELQPGEPKTVHFTLDRTAFSYWDPEKKAWTWDAGKFEIQVGSSSMDILLRAKLEMK